VKRIDRLGTSADVAQSQQQRSVVYVAESFAVIIIEIEAVVFCCSLIMGKTSVILVIVLLIGVFRAEKGSLYCCSYYYQ